MPGSNNYLLRAAAMTMAIITVGCSSAATRPTSAPTLSSATAPASVVGSEPWWQQATAPLGGERSLRGTVYTVRVPRDDLMVQSEMGIIPTEAGIGSTFYFWRCDCGRGLMAGEMVVANSESGEVLAELNSNGFTIASMSPILLSDTPRLLSIRFQGEGDLAQLVKTLRAALDDVAPHRFAAQEPATQP